MTALVQTTGANTSSTRGRTPAQISFRRIVVGTDFSGPAQCALQDAIALAKQFGANLTLVHAASPFLYSTGDEIVPYEILEKNLSAIRAQLNQDIQNDPNLHSLSPKVVTEYSEPVALICNVAAADTADLIILGSHGASGLERLALGSVAECVLHRTSTPVLIVGPHCKPEADLLRSILLATDLRTTPKRAAEISAAFAEHSHGKLTSLHVLHQKPSPDAETLARLHQQAMHELTVLLPDSFPNDCAASVKVLQGDVAQTIVMTAFLESATLIVLGTRSRMGLEDHAPWSTFAHVVREAHCPVLGVPSLPN